MLAFADHDVTRLIPYIEQQLRNDDLHVVIIGYYAGPHERSAFEGGLGPLQTKGVTLLWVPQSDPLTGWDYLTEVLANDQAVLVAEWRLLGDGEESTIPDLLFLRSEARPRIFGWTSPEYYQRDAKAYLGDNYLEVHEDKQSRDPISSRPYITDFRQGDRVFDPFGALVN